MPMPGSWTKHGNGKTRVVRVVTHYASCRCGWRSPTTSDPVVAVVMGLRHEATMLRRDHATETGEE